MTQNDYEFALLLQNQFNQEIQVDNPTQNLVYSKQKSVQNNAKSLTDPSWELIDPTPNIYVLFVAFNEKYFWKKLVTVSVSWSKRMTSCAGICSYQGRGGLCHITLSEPLLKLRPRKDLIETLLHEMIHAYLFVTHNNKDRDGHGPEFHKHMYRINAEAGTNITVYHTFHDEVRLYKQHWWKCNGPCQHRHPYYGMVKRAMNRAPGPNDRWWAEHQQNCGGTYIKIKEPEKYSKAKSQKENKSGKERNDIRNFYPLLNKNSSSEEILNGLTTNKKSPNKFNDTEITNNNMNVLPTKTVTPFEGVGRILGASSSESADYSVVRNTWLNKFSQSTSVKRPATNNSYSVSDNKHRKTEKTKTDEVIIVEEFTDCPVCDSCVSIHEINTHLDSCLIKHSNDNLNKSSEISTCLICNKVLTSSFIEHLNECVVDACNDNNSENRNRTENDDNQKMYNCPICFKLFSFKVMSTHIETCMKEEDTGQNDSLIEIFDEPF